MIRLGVNVDHIATLRNARDEAYPSPVHAACLAETGGAANITCHLREDRRHIRDADVAQIKAAIAIPLNFEMAVTDEMISFAQQIRPHAVTLVPEKREERTTEGGLDLIQQKARVRDAVTALRESGILVSLFVEPTVEAMELSSDLGADAVELHTGLLCKQLDRLTHTRPKFAALRSFVDAAETGHRLGLQIHVGHGLNYANAPWIQHIPYCEEANIGHAIVARATAVGMVEATRQMLDLITNPHHRPKQL